METAGGLLDLVASPPIRTRARGCSKMRVPAGRSARFDAGRRALRVGRVLCSPRSVSDSAPRIDVTPEASALLAAALAESGSAQFIRVQVERG